MNFEATILEYCKINPGTTFAQLSRDIEGFDGDLSLMEGTYKNIMLWDRISEPAAAALEKLIRDKKIEYKPFGSAFLAYHVDGLTIKLPLAGDFKHYRTFHWLPVLIIAI